MREETRVECGIACGEKRGIFRGMGAGHVCVCVTCAYMRDIMMHLRDAEIDVSDAEIALSAQKSASAPGGLGRAWGLGHPGAQPGTNCNNVVTFPFFRYNSVTFPSVFIRVPRAGCPQSLTPPTGL